jgi:hypothetical protein
MQAEVQGALALKTILQAMLQGILQGAGLVGYCRKVLIERFVLDSQVSILNS